MATTRLVGWTAIEAAERGGQALSKHADPTDGARDGLSVDEARAVATEDPALVYLDLPVADGRVDVGAGRVWVDHPVHGWIEMPARYSSDGITEEDLVMDCQMRKLSDREVRDIAEGGAPVEPAVEVTSVYIQGAVGLLAAGEVDAAAGAVDVAARSLGDDHPEVQAMRNRVLTAAGGQPIDAGAFRPYRHRAWGSEPACITVESEPSGNQPLLPAAPALSEIETALAEAGVTGLKIEIFADGAGAVVNDGEYLWTCRPERLLRAAESMVEDGTAERLIRLDGEDQMHRYDVLCSRAGDLSRSSASAEDRALHERVVQEWREEHQSEGNWS